MLRLYAAEELGIRECNGETEVGIPDPQRFLLVILQGAFLCPLHLSFGKPLISLVRWAAVAVEIDERQRGRREARAIV